MAVTERTSGRRRYTCWPDTLCFGAGQQHGVNFRDAQETHEAFIFQLKTAAEKTAVTKVFGWDEQVQYQLHHQEWRACKPTLICWHDTPIGSVLLESVTEADPSAAGEASCRYLYFSRFFLLPEWQGRGIGTAVMSLLEAICDAENLPCQLMYLQGNQVFTLYQRHGFHLLSQDHQFVSMVRLPNATNHSADSAVPLS
ncbi:GNAT family N-acetyltransferase [Photobacterium sp. Hal280]|uniref:GNAT family N-acetyltransferase n=1 Tax=Photobacterium sp. Hal280 TaxID=3035163 RepID=UPI00301D48D0